MSDTYFLTGALGCIGSWVVKHLVERGDHAVVYDLAGDPRRIRDILDEDHFAKVSFCEGDITDGEAVKRAVQESGASKIIHLAALQVPFCKADPAQGARVNVLGTIHLFEAAKAAGVERLVYASSAAVYGPRAGGANVPDEGAECEPGTHYGVYKRANEGNARVYWQDDGVSSVGLRPLTVYGVGRDQGLTSAPTTAMKAAVLGQEFKIGFRGATDFHYVADTAAAFVASADRAPAGAQVYNLHGEAIEVDRFVELIDECSEPDKRGLVHTSGEPIQMPPAIDGTRIHEHITDLPTTAVAEGVRETMVRFRALHEAGRLDTRDLSANRS
jgi:nucleoside-diphosphate-sugar epimerase